MWNTRRPASNHSTKVYAFKFYQKNIIQLKQYFNPNKQKILSNFEAKVKEFYLILDLNYFNNNDLILK